MSRLGVVGMVCILGLTASCVSDSPSVHQDPQYGPNLDPSPLGGKYSSPQKTFERFCRAISEQDIDTVKLLTWSVDRDAVDWDAFAANIRNNHEAIKEIIEGAEMKSVQTHRVNGLAMVKWSGDGPIEALQFTFEDGLWRIGGSLQFGQKPDTSPAANVPLPTPPAPAPPPAP